jgi:type II secretory pathway component PulF
MIKAGEYSGSLSKALNEVADELEQKEVFLKKIRTALAYPCLLLMAVLIVLYVLSTGVLPMYERLFESMGVELPKLTKVIFMVGRKFPEILKVMAVFFVAGLFFAKLLNPKGWKMRLKTSLRFFPFLGKIYYLSELVQFTQVLCRLLATGIPLLDALHLTAGTLQAPEILELTEQLIQNVRQGNPMANLLYASKYFPKEGVEMIAVGEETGRLEKMLSHLSRLFRSDLEYQLERFTHLLEPSLILIMAGLIGIVAGGIMVPIFDLSSHME